MNQIQAWTQESYIIEEYEKQGYSTTFVDYLDIDSVEQAIQLLDDYIELSAQNEETVVMMIELSHVDDYKNQDSLSNLDSTGVNPPKLYFESKDASRPGNLQVLKSKEAIPVSNPYLVLATHLDFFYYCAEDTMDKGIWYRLLFVAGKGLVDKAESF